MLEWALIWTYWGLLAVITTVVTVKGNAPMRRTIATLLAVCAVQFLFASYVAPFGARPHTIFMFCVDALACWNITRRPAGEWQSVIGFSFILQLGMHIGNLAANNPDMNFYWGGLTFTGYLQLLLFGGWWLDERGLLPRWVRRHIPVISWRREGVE